VATASVLSLSNFLQPNFYSLFILKMRRLFFQNQPFTSICLSSFSSTSSCP